MRRVFPIARRSIDMPEVARRAPEQHVDGRRCCRVSTRHKGEYRFYRGFGAGLKLGISLHEAYAGSSQDYQRFLFDQRKPDRRHLRDC